MKRICILAFAVVFPLFLAGQPRLEHRSNSTARIVANGKPMLMIGGELGNSSASTPEDVKRTFSHLSKIGLNTVLAPVSWELIEPQEGTFDMSSLDAILTEARRNGLKVVLLWFGAWKNSMSCYAPEWFKRDVKRFPRAHTPEGKPVEEASSLSRNVLEADKRVFCRIMEHLRDHDAQEQTVIMVQVENEMGMIEVPRDYSDDATRMYRSAVPQQLTAYLAKHQKSLHPYLKEKLQPQAKAGADWAQLFGDDIYTEEIFQTWTYATYVEQIAKAGREIYDLPMYVNVALDSRGRKPGQYPSGGPLAHLIDLWHCGAPSIDVLGVDIYDKGIRSWLSKYHLPNNPLFVPEIRLDDKDALYALYAFGRRRRDDEHLAYPREHQGRQRIKHHRLVVYGQKLLRHDARERMKTRSRAAREYDSLPCHHFPSHDSMSLKRGLPTPFEKSDSLYCSENQPQLSPNTLGSTISAPGISVATTFMSP